MSVAKLGKSRQVALPKHLIEEMGLAEGDFFEIKREGDRIVLIPKALVDTAKARAQLRKLLKKSWSSAERRDPKEIEAAIEQAIREARSEQI